MSRIFSTELAFSANLSNKLKRGIETDIYMNSLILTTVRYLPCDTIIIINYKLAIHP